MFRNRSRGLSILRLIRKAERMAAVGAHILCVSHSVREEPDAVCPEEARQRVPNRLLIAGLLEKTVTAVAGVLDEAVACRNRVHAMPEKSACVANSLYEAIALGEPVVLCRKNQRMSATHAHIFMNAVTIGKPHVRVMAKEARQRVSNVGQRAVFGKIARAAAALPRGSGRAPKDLVVDDVTPERTAELNDERWTRE